MMKAHLPHLHHATASVMQSLWRVSHLLNLHDGYAMICQADSIDILNRMLRFNPKDCAMLCHRSGAIAAVPCGCTAAPGSDRSDGRFRAQAELRKCTDES